MPMPQPLSRQSDLVLSHMGFYVKNLEAMGQFYKDVNWPMASRFLT